VIARRRRAMLVKNLPKMVRYLKDRGTYVLFNTTGRTQRTQWRALIEAGLDEPAGLARCCQCPSPTARCRGKDYSAGSSRTCAPSARCRSAREPIGTGVGLASPGSRRPSSNCRAFVKVAAEIGVKEVLSPAPRLSSRPIRSGSHVRTRVLYEHMTREKRLSRGSDRSSRDPNA